jgi:phenylalanine-4-hydroxylase
MGTGCPKETVAMRSEMSAHERTVDQRTDPRCVPVKLAAPAPLGEAIVYPDYPAEDQQTWSLLYRRQRELLPRRACREFLDGLDRMGFREERIPALEEVDRVLRDTTGWRVARVPGLLHEQDFFAFLARRVFPSTDYVRPRSELDYTPAPDLFHDVFGHMPMITEPVFASFYQQLGQAAVNARGEDRCRLERFYWFTVEFGLIRTVKGMRIYGNGILSSHAEVRHSLTDRVAKLPFDPERITCQDYDVWHLQPLLFVIDSFGQLAAGFHEWARGRGLL